MGGEAWDDEADAPVGPDPAHRALLLAEARLLHAACAYCDAEVGDRDLDTGLLYQELERARHDYGAALRALPPVPADHPLVEQGMRVVRRLLRGSTP